MGDGMETQLLATMFDRLYDIVTYAPDNGKVGAFDKKTTFVQLGKAMALNPDDFKNAASPLNPNGDLRTAQVFSNYWNAVPNLSTVYVPSLGSIEDQYKIAIQANVVFDTSLENSQQQQLYQKAFNFLNTTSKVTDFEGNVTEVTGPSLRYQTYLEKKLAYTAALVAYRTAYTSYDLDKIDDQRKWQANAPLLQANIDAAYSKWRISGADQIEQAENALATTINNVVATFFADSRKQFDTTGLTDVGGFGGTNWHLSYAIPSNWYDPAAADNFTAITIESSKLNKTISDRFTSYGGGASFGRGLFSIGGGASGSTEEHYEHMEASNFSLAARIGTVQIMRPWFRSALFGLQGWYLEGQDAGSLTPGALDKATEKTGLPLLPVAFVVARDVEITADWSASDLETIKKSFSANFSVGWGPFRLSGRYSKSTSDSTFNARMVGNTLKVPGIQVIAVVNSVLPFAPPLGPNGLVPAQLSFLFADEDVAVDGVDGTQ